MQKTSLQAYFKEVLPKLGQKQAEVLQAMTQKENFTNAELAEFLQWPINTVTPRVLELRKLSVVEEAGERFCKATGRKAKAWRPVTGDRPQPTKVYDPRIYKLKNEYRFESLSRPGLFYTCVWLGSHWNCDCPAWVNRKTCRHLLLINGFELKERQKLKSSEKQAAMF